MSEDKNPAAQLVAALTVCLAQTARVVSEVLANEDMTADDRQKLRLSLGQTITSAAAAMDEARPGAGEVLVRIYTGEMGP